MKSLNYPDGNIRIPQIKSFDDLVDYLTHPLSVNIISKLMVEYIIIDNNSDNLTFLQNWGFSYEIGFIPHHENESIIIDVRNIEAVTKAKKRKSIIEDL